MQPLSSSFGSAFAHSTTALQRIGLSRRQVTHVQKLAWACSVMALMLVGGYVIASETDGVLNNGAVAGEQQNMLDAAARHTYTIATPKRDGVIARARPELNAPPIGQPLGSKTLDTTALGTKAAFLLLGVAPGGDKRPDWYQILIPGKTGETQVWVRAVDVNLTGADASLTIRRDALRLDVMNGQNVRHSLPLGIGDPAMLPVDGTYSLLGYIQPKDQTQSEYGAGLIVLNELMPEANRNMSPVAGHYVISGTQEPTEVIGKVGGSGADPYFFLRNDDLVTAMKELPIGAPIRVLP